MRSDPPAEPATKLAAKLHPKLHLDVSQLKPGLRLVVGLSGGADSVALLCALAEQNRERGRELGLVLHAAHLHHGLRGAEADGDLKFARDLAAQLGVVFHEARVDTAAEARAASGKERVGRSGESAKAAETIEEAARRLRYGWFRELMASGEVDAVATAHTRDDQAETVLGKFLRGAWTEGLSGIHPVVEFPEGRILRPMLGVTRPEVEVYLAALGQSWREDSSNRHLTFTRNRIRHELLPLLEGWNPRLREHLAQMAQLALDEEAWWQAELARLAPQLLLAGRPVRGGGRASGEGLAVDVIRLAALAPALQRRLLRHAAAQLGAAPDFAATESLRELALEGRAGQKLALAQGLTAERTPRELRLAVLPASAAGARAADEALPEYTVTVPGEVAAPAFGIRLRVEALGEAREQGTGNREQGSGAGNSAPAVAVLRNWKPGDRVTLRHSSGPRKVKEVLERLRVTGSGRTLWPVLSLDGQIVWMQGVEVEPGKGIEVVATGLDEGLDGAAGAPSPKGISASG
jgi:tRNA(Ile)-lysidine synthase